MRFTPSAVVQKCGLLLGLMGCLSGNAIALDVSVVAAAKQDPLLIYKSPADTMPSGKLAVKDLPWTILEESREGFLLVNVQGKRVWIDSMDVIANRKSANRCSKGLAVLDVAGQPGAANDLCK